MIRFCGFIILSREDYQEALNNAATRGHYLKRQQEGVDRINREYIKNLLNAQVRSFNLPTGEADEMFPYMLVDGKTAENYSEAEQ